MLEVHGELDIATAPTLCREIDAAAANEASVILDLSDVTSCDVSGLRSLVGATREAAVRACRLVVAVSERSALDRLITSTGAREFLRIKGRAPGEGSTGRRRDVFIGPARRLR